MPTIAVVLIAASTLGLGVLIGYTVSRMNAAGRVRMAEVEAERILEDARAQSATLKREALMEAREENHRLRKEFEREARERRQELQQTEQRIRQREEALDRKASHLERKEEALRATEAELKKMQEQVEALRVEQQAELERIAALTREEAKQILFDRVERETRTEMSQMIREMEDEARAEAERRAREIIGLAIQRCAAEHVAESTVSVVTLPSDDMKGRVIGREGRNIRTFEALTGVDLIIDDTPEAVVISCFDPIRREKARLALEKLVADGRIHPARIEEMHAKADQEIENRIRECGERAVYDLGLHGIHPELVYLLGRLAFRTSYGQNVLKHSIEVAHLASLMAAELEANVEIARRAGLLHDIGKAVDHEYEGTHVTIGIDLLRRYGEHEEVIHAMACHHGDYEPETVEAVLVAAADALSAARPGARRETLESYIKRLHTLETIADSFEGVEKAYAIQAGRELRIMVKPDKVNDEESFLLARDVTRQIKERVQHPGQIKVVVIRETRAIEYAK